MKIGIIGLGKMGSRIAQKLYEDGHEVFAWNRSWDATKKFLESLRSTAIKSAEVDTKIFSLPAQDSKKSNLKIESSNKSSENFVYPRAFNTISKLISELPKPRVIWLMLPAGEPTQNILDQVQKLLQKGDVVIDGGNAHFHDTEKRYQHFKKLGIEFLGIGVSGGVIAAKNGYPLMVGGSKKAYEFITPILDSLSKPNGGHEYFGEGGAGHFVKMVHNGIEYGIMQSLGEGFEVLEKSKYKFNLLEVAKLWQKGSLVSGFMLDRTADALAQSSNLQNMAGSISESGEARWTVEEAKKENVQVKIIQDSLDYRIHSQTDRKVQNSFTTKMINALRNAFGGHSIRRAQDESEIKK
jgi:6-phosphogluconate dehydrogenase